MRAPARLTRAHELLQQAIEEIDLAIEDLPPYAVESARFLVAEVKVARRRIGNVVKVIASRGRRVGE